MSRQIPNPIDHWVGGKVGKEPMWRLQDYNIALIIPIIRARVFFKIISRGGLIN